MILIFNGRRKVSKTFGTRHWALEWGSGLFFSVIRAEFTVFLILKSGLTVVSSAESFEVVYKIENVKIGGLKW